MEELRDFSGRPRKHHWENLEITAVELGDFGRANERSEDHGRMLRIC